MVGLATSPRVDLANQDATDESMAHDGANGERWDSVGKTFTE